MIQANSLMMFQYITNNTVTIEQHQDGETMIAMLRDGNSAALLILSLKTVKPGYYSLAYHYIAEDNETSQDFSLPFAANYAKYFIAAIVNDVF